MVYLYKIILYFITCPALTVHIIDYLRKFVGIAVNVLTLLLYKRPMMSLIQGHRSVLAAVVLP